MRPSGQPPLPGPDTASVPASLVVATLVVGVEALALVLFGLAEVFWVSSSRMAMGVSTSLFFVVYGVGLGLLGWQLQRRRSWARAPVVLAQLIQLGVAWSFRSGSTGLVSALLLASAAVTLVAVFHPASMRALAEPED